MKSQTILSTLVALPVFLLAGSALAQGGNTGPDSSPATRETVENRIGDVERLIQVSSVAKRISEGKNDAAKKKKEESARLWRSAQKQFDEGHYQESDRLLSEATLTMFEAVRLLGPPEETAKKNRKDIDARLASAEALLVTLRRISKQKKMTDETRAAATMVERGIEDARRLSSEGDLTEARRVADEAYEVAKLNVESLRQGETVVRTLEFETIEDEYRYELDRNDTHQMLVKFLLAEKRKSPMVDEMVEKNVRRAQLLREQAESQARAGDMKAAIQTLELSTKELVRTIRNAGIYIPG